jgi:tetratricopeptide (TPR) repeat protein
MVLTALEVQLKEAAEWSLRHHLVSNAVFMAERLNAEASATPEDAEVKLNTLALSYLAEAQPHKVVSVLKTSSSEDNRYLYALAFFQINKWEEAEKILLRLPGPPLGAAGYFLLGQVCERLVRLQDAISHYSRALSLNPHLWTAYERLCKLGHYMDPSSAFASPTLKENFSSPGQSESQHSPPQLQPLTASYIDNSQSSLPYSPAKQPSRVQSELADLLEAIGKAFQCLSKFECDDALAFFRELPIVQQNSGWVLCQVAKCYFEKYEFSLAIDTFQRAYREDPHRVEDTEIYSSALWYEKRATDLCYLLHNLMKNAYHSSQTWIVAGNFYSLQKERETAIKCFTRAIQLNPFNSYAYTLCAHEYLNSEDFERAKQHYEAAKNIDPRQYSALWGLGTMFFKQEKYTLSLQCYKAARLINPRSSILLTYIGVNYKAIGHYKEAIDCYELAIKLDRKNPLPRFQLGVLLSILDREEEALAQLEFLRHESPRESHLYIQIGKIYAKLGQSERALKYYNDAQELNPKASTEIKNLIEQLHGVSFLGQVRS